MKRSILLLTAILACSASQVSCAAFSSSKVARGELYTSGDGRYDSYFAAVHQEQAAARKWNDERKATRKPLITALAAPSSVSDGYLTSATKDRVRNIGGDGAVLDLSGPRVVRAANSGPDRGFFQASEETARAELGRARRLAALGAKLEALAKQGDGLKADADREFDGRVKADEKKSQHLREVRRELGEAASAMRGLASDARTQVDKAADFLDDLAYALGPTLVREASARKAIVPEPAVQAAKAEDEKKDDKKAEEAKAAAAKKPAAKASTKPAEKPAPSEKPAPAEKPAPVEKPAPKPEENEVFNP